MFRKFLAAFMIIFFAASTTALAAENKLIIFDGVTVEYPFPDHSTTIIKDGVVFASGVATGPLNWDKQDSFYKTFARQAARIEALRNLAEKIDGVIVTQYNADKFSVQISHDSKAFKLLEKNARQVGNVTFDADGVCELFMAVRVEPRK